jgi:hypothetical protein
MDDYARLVLDRAKAGVRAPSQALAQGLAQDLAPAQRSPRRRQKGLAGADL